MKEMINTDGERCCRIPRAHVCVCVCFSGVDLYRLEKVGAHPRINLLKTSNSLSPPLTDFSSILNNGWDGRQGWDCDCGNAKLAL